MLMIGWVWVCGLLGRISFLKPLVSGRPSFPCLSPVQENVGKFPRIGTTYTGGVLASTSLQVPLLCSLPQPANGTTHRDCYVFLQSKVYHINALPATPVPFSIGALNALRRNVIVGQPSSRSGKESLILWHASGLARACGGRSHDPRRSHYRLDRSDALW
jgi:hypothetical protein